MKKHQAKKPILPKKQKSNSRSKTLVKKRTRSSSDTITMCALKFAVAASRPFDPMAQGACLPVAPSLPSQKITLSCRFIATVGSFGYGFVVFTPSLSGQMPCAYTTTRDYSQVNMGLLAGNSTLGPGVIPVTCPGSPYTKESFVNLAGDNDQLMTGRIVAGGARISYIGTTLQQSGNVLSFVDPVHSDVCKTDTLFGPTGNATASFKPVSRGHCGEVSFFPVNAEETAYGHVEDPSVVGAYTKLLYPYSGGNTTAQSQAFSEDALEMPVVFGVYVGSPIASFQINSEPGNQFLVEYVLHVEYVGTLARAYVTPTHVDELGFNKVQQSLASAPRRMAADPKLSLWDAVRSGLATVAQEMKPIAVSAIAKMGSMALAAL